MPVAGEKAAKWPFHSPLQVPQKVAHKGSAVCISGVMTRSTETWLHTALSVTSWARVQRRVAMDRLQGRMMMATPNAAA